jgi:hypothetical protein
VEVFARSRHRLLLLLAAALVVPALLAGSAGSFPGANGLLAFVRGGTLFTAQVGGAETNLGLTPASHPMWSPDGSKIAYDDGTNIHVVNADGSALSPAVQFAGVNPAWSPDGSKIAFDDGTNVHVVNADGSPLSPAFTAFAGTDPVWSPDGTEVAFVSGGDVQLRNLASAATTNLTASAATDASPTWSPDGTKIAFTSTRDNATGELYTMNADGSAQTRVNPATAGASSPSWSPDGTKIAFSKPDSGGNDDVWAVTVADGTLSQLTTNPADDLQADWQSAFSIGTPVVDPSHGVADGTVLTVLPVSHIGSAPATGFSYAWQRCSAAGTNCDTIADAADSSYTVTSLDVGSTIRAVVTATSTIGSATARSEPTDVVTAVAPSNVVAPSVTGATSVSVGVELKADDGTWKGTTPISFARSWSRCDSGGASCSPIAGATGTSYTPTDADVGSTLRVQVSANNGIGGAVVAQSPATSKVASSVPANVDAPTISGTVDVGSFLFADEGNWTGAGTITFSYQWQRCVDGGSCTNVPNAISTSYTVTNADAGSRLRVQVTGKNTFGSGNASSAQTDVVKGIAPTNTFAPTVSGFAQVGESLFASPGVWSGSPTSYKYEWRRCTSATACTAISGATSATYNVTSADVGSSLLVVVTAQNSLGSAQASSARTAVVTEGTATTAPTSRKAPTITGVAAKGRKLTAQRGTWAGATPLTFVYEWQRCSRQGASCLAIRTATKQTYTVAAADVGKRLRVLVTARNTDGRASATSNPTAVVKAKATPNGKRMSGNATANRLVGAGGPDVIHGLSGNDRIDGKAGNDKLYGDAGNDTVVGGTGLDSVYGGIGNDSINTADRARDVVDCGPGLDRAVVDRIDVVRGCERVTRRG